MLASCASQKVNSKENAKQKLPIPCIEQKISTRKKKYPVFRAHKKQKITTEHLLLFTTSINNAKDELEDFILYSGVKSIDVMG